MTLDTIINPTASLNNIEVKRQTIISLLGHHDMETDHVIDAIIDEQISESQRKVAANGAYVIKEIQHLDTEKGTITIDNIELQIKRTIALQLKKAEKVALFICTIGNEVENRAKILMDGGDFLEGYATDLIGSTAAEAVAENLHKVISQQMSEFGLNVTNRFSPGYCNWDVHEQFKLFELIGDHNCGVTLTDSALMHPVKSVSGLLGIGKAVKWRPYTCDICTDKHCVFRGKK